MKILLVPDVPGWAFDHIAEAIMVNLPQYEFAKIYQSQYREEMLKHFDKVFFFQWNAIRGNPADLYAAICSHNYHLLHDQVSKVVLPQFKAMMAISYELYDKIKLVNPNTFCCPHGVDHRLFAPTPRLERKKFAVGWCGQKLKPNARLDGRPYDMKGARFVLKHVIDRLSDHPEIEFKINDNTPRNPVPLREMPSFYNDVDVQICTSFREGTPAPIFEAASCGNATIGTKVGCIPQLITNGVNGFLVDSYDNEQEALQRADDIIGHILFLNENRDVCKEMGQLNRAEIEKSWTWEKLAQNYIPLFDFRPEE